MHLTMFPRFSGAMFSKLQAADYLLCHMSSNLLCCFWIGGRSDYFGEADCQVGI